MDEGTLNDLLECSVCLDRLDTSSRVLPCQHTFCRKCLQEIVHKHKELRCPECRIIVKLKVDELPPNVLLMRILEGMKNIPPRLQKGGKIGNNQATPQVQQATPVHHSTPDRKLNKQNPPHLISHQPYAKALYDYEAKVAGDLSFKRDDLIFLRERVDANWYQGECRGKHGLFPLRYVQVITPLPSHVPQCKALYDFQTDKHEEEGCLVFKEGDLINVIRRVDENWAEGKLENGDGRIGIFPLTFVELNNLARSLMKLSTNAQPGPSRVAPPTPTTEDSTPLIPTDHSTGVVVARPQPTPQNVQPLATSDSSGTISSGSSSTTTPNVSSSNNSSSNSSTAPSSPASPPSRVPRKLDVVLNPSAKRSPSNHPETRTSSHRQHSKEKRHSFTDSTQNFNKSSHNRHSAEIPSSEVSISAHSHCSESRNKRGGGGEAKLPSPYVALFPYKPQKSDELELRKGGIYMVTERCQDGWFKGTSNRTQKCGVFPGNYVTHMALNKSASGASSASGPSGHSAGPVDSKSVSFPMSNKIASPRQYNNLPPELPPRSVSPAATNNTNTISSSWHGQQDNACGVPLGRSSSAIVNSKNSDKHKERKDKGVGLMRRLASMKRSKSPPPSSYSMDNPVFEDTTTSSSGSTHPVHVRSGSCPSQLLQIQPSTDHHRLFGSSSQRLKHKERPSVLTHSLRGVDLPAFASSTSPVVHHHRKSNSLDAGNRSKTGVQSVHELFKCEIPYPPNSDYELELQKDDIIYVHKKREDGWYKGTLQRTGKTGLFPASFVKAMQ